MFLLAKKLQQLEFQIFIEYHNRRLLQNESDCLLKSIMQFFYTLQ